MEVCTFFTGKNLYSPHKSSLLEMSLIFYTKVIPPFERRLTYILTKIAKKKNKKKNKTKQKPKKNKSNIVIVTAFVINSSEILTFGFV